MMTRISKFIIILPLMLSSIACIVPMLSEEGRDFLDYLLDEGVMTPEATQPAIPVPADQNTTNDNIAGAADIYKGTSNISDIWVNSFGGNVYLNNFEITIDKDGKITGILESFWETEDSEPMSWEPSPGAALLYCVTQMSNIDQGTITGSIMNPDASHPNIYGLIELNMSSKKQIFRSDCPENDEENLSYYKLYGEIDIKGDQLTGKVDNAVGGIPVIIQAIRQ